MSERYWAVIGSKTRASELKQALDEIGADYEPHVTLPDVLTQRGHRTKGDVFRVTYDDDMNTAMMVAFRLKGLLEDIDLIDWSGNHQDVEDP